MSEKILEIFPRKKATVDKTPVTENNIFWVLSPFCSYIFNVIFYVTTVTKLNLHVIRQLQWSIGLER